MVGIKSWAESQLIINEVRSSNGIYDNYYEDSDSLKGDYIEIYNPTNFNISLSNFFVSDNLNGHPKQISKNGIIASKGYAIIYTEEGDNGFAISNNGDEIIYLLDASDNIIDSVSIPKIDKGKVYARNNLNYEWGVHYPSPLTENIGDEIRILPDPIFSAESGFYDKPFTLKISASENCKIYYTVDGSLPDESSILYENEITVADISDKPNVYRSIQNVILDWQTFTPSLEPVDKATIIRAVAIDEYGNNSDIVTKIYFVNLNQYKNNYIISIIANPDELFGPDGIYVTGDLYDVWYTGNQEDSQPIANFMKSGRDYEVEATVDLFYNQLLMSQNAGLRIQGGSSRNLIIKSFKLYARKIYNGSRFFDYNIFGYPIHCFLIRNGNSGGGFADSFLQSLAPDRGLGGLRFIPVYVFLDGEFWEESYLRESYDEDYLAQKFNLNSNEITIISSMPIEVYDFLNEHDLSDEKNYLLFDELIDIQNYIDFLVYNIYMNNIDQSETFNIKIWKSEGYSGLDYDDGKWRFLLYDLDSINWSYVDDTFAFNVFIDEHEFSGVPYDKQTVFSALKRNENFCKQFVLTFMDFANTYFEKGNVEQQLRQWGYDLTWCNSFFEKRFDYIVPDLAEEFDLTGTLERITLKVDIIDSGTISINTVTPDLSDGEWSGYYYTDYPITISALPSDGYEFNGWWHGNEFYKEPIIEVKLNKDDNVWKAEFVKRK